MDRTFWGNVSRQFCEKGGKKREIFIEPRKEGISWSSVQRESRSFLLRRKPEIVGPRGKGLLK